MSEQTLSGMLKALDGSQQAFMDLLDQADDKKLYKKSGDDDWTPAMALVHIAEARQFFAGEVQKIVAEPGVQVGRTMDDPHRVQTIATHSNNPPDDIRRGLTTSHQEVTKTLSAMNDESLTISAEYVNGDSYTLAEFIQRFLVGHDKSHVQQVTTLLQS